MNLKGHPEVQDISNQQLQHSQNNFYHSWQYVIPNNTAHIVFSPTHIVSLFAGIFSVLYCQTIH